MGEKDKVGPLRESPGIKVASRISSRVDSFAEKGDLSFEAMSRHADGGDAKYQFAVGLNYLNGRNGAKKSIPDAIRYFKLAVIDSRNNGQYITSYNFCCFFKLQKRN